MAEESVKRRLAAILAADVVGYSRLVSIDEDGTLSAFRSHLTEFIEPTFTEYNGRLFKTMGDGLLAEFASVVEAVQCAVAIQQGISQRNSDAQKDRRIEFRIGINLGDVVVQDGDVFGDGVNVAARLEGLAESGGICISRSARDQIRDKLEYGLEDWGEVEVKNIPRPVRVFRVLPDEQDAGKIITKPADTTWKHRSVAVAMLLLLLVAAAGVVWWQPWKTGTERVPRQQQAVAPKSDKPVIAVLPFDNMSRDTQQDYFSDGITDDVISDLSRISGLFVIARSTMFTYKGNPVKVQQIAQQLGAGYVLEGSVQKAGNRVRVNAQLVDARTGHHLWADRYDRELSDVFALQDEVVQKIVAALSVKLRTSELDQLTRSAKVHPEAYDMLLRGLETHRQLSRETIAESRGFFERAIAFDPTFARAHAALALSYIIAVDLGLTDEREASTRRALEIAQQALALDDTIREVHFVLSIVYRIIKRHDEAIAAARRAIVLDPNYADGYALLAIDLNYAGKPVEGLVAIEHAMLLNPRYSFFYRWILGQSYYLLDRHEEAIKLFERAKTGNPHFTVVHKLLGATYSALGRDDDAEWAAAELMTLIPNFSLEQELANVPYKDAAVRQRYIDRLRKAGLPE